jgi:hypothetical protein
MDLEASSLGSASYPTEIDWCLLHDDGTINTSGCLNRPAAKWTGLTPKFEEPPRHRAEADPRRLALALSGLRP